jgi:tetratricopeptide (TPR) repeat protein
MTSGLAPGARYTVDEALDAAATARAQSRLRDAELLCRAVLDGEPGHPGANHELGLVGLALGRPADALAHLRIAAAAAPDREAYWQGLAEAAARADRLDALTAAIAAHAASIASPQTRRFVAVLAFRLDVAQVLPPSGNPTRSETDAVIALVGSGRLDAARAAAEGLTLRYPLDGFGWKAFGTALLLAKQGAQACPPLEIATALLPEDPETHNSLGAALRAAGRPADAESSFRRALALRADFAEAHNNLGLVQLDRGDVAAAESSFRASLAASPGYADAHNNLGRALQAQSRLFEAERCYLAAAHADPSMADAPNNLGSVLRALGKFEDAAACFARARRIRPDFAAALNNEGAVLRDLGRNEEALAALTRALELEPGLAAAHNNVGSIHEDFGRLEEARACFERALALQPGFAAAFANLGDVLCDLDDAAAAAAAYSKALALDPDDVGLDAGVYLAVLEYLRDDLQACGAALDATRRIIDRREPKRRNAQVYWRFLERLVAWRATAALAEDKLPAMFAVGESHVLSAHGLRLAHRGVLRRCRSEWIWGCKQWHLGGGRPNRFARRFDAVLARLPEASTVLLAVGEIDCRFDGGIAKAAAKNPERPLSDIVRDTARGYVDSAVGAAAAKGHRLVFSGIPASFATPTGVSAAAVAENAAIIRLMNSELAARAAAAGHDFLDVFAMTDRGTGRASGQHHIDRTHLHPERVVEAFASYCRLA